MPTSTTIHSISIAMSVKIDVPEKVLEIDAGAYAAANDIQKTIMIIQAGVSPDKAAGVVQELNKLFGSTSTQTTTMPADPFGLLDTASENATAVFYDTALMQAFTRTTTVLGPNLAGLAQLVLGATDKGLTFVQDPWVKQVLGQYNVIARQTGGGIVQLTPNPKYGIAQPMMVNILPPDIRREITGSILGIWEQTPLDEALRAAKEYADLASKKEGANAGGVQMFANAGDLSATAEEVRADLIDALNAVTILMQQGLLDTRAEMLANELAFIVLPALKDAGFVHNNLSVPVQSGQDPFQMFLNASGAAGAGMNLALAMRNAGQKVAQLDQAEDFNAYLVELGKLGQVYSRAVERFHRHAPRRTVTPTGFTGVTSVAVDLRAMISVDTTGRIQVDVTSSTTVTQGPIVIDWFNEAYKAVEFDGFATTGSPFSVGSWSQFSARVEGDKLVIMRGRNEYRASNSAEFKIALERVTGSTFTDNDAHKALQELTSRGLTKTLRGQGQPNIQNLVVELGMDWDNLAGATKDAKVNSLVDTVRRAGRVENLYLAMIRIGILG